MLKKILLGLAAVVLVVVLVTAGFAFYQIRTFDRSVERVWDVPAPEVSAVDDPAVIDRGWHLAESIGGCHACHGDDGASGETVRMGPLVTLPMPNITAGRNGTLAEYTDGELARLVKHGVKRDGRSVVYMPSHEVCWLPDEDLVALVSYLRTLEPRDSEPTEVTVGVIGKILDRMDALPLDIARRIDHENPPQAPRPAPTAQYGAFIAMACTGCHGETLAGGPLPGMPPVGAAPGNLTPHASGLADWSFEDFDRAMREGLKPDGTTLDPFMPIDSWRNMNEIEMQALFAYLQSVPPVEYGRR